MKFSTWAGIAVVGCCVWILAGCEEREPTTTCGGCGGSINFWMSDDMLFCWGGDTVSVDGIVLVTDCFGGYGAGYKVNLSLAEPFGQIEFDAGGRHDTTDQYGRMRFRYVVRDSAHVGTQIITAATGEWSADWRLELAPGSDIVYRATIAVIPDTIHLGAVPFSDSSRVSVMLSDSGNNPPRCPGTRLRIWVSYGEVDSFPPLDGAGRTSSWWHLPHDAGIYYVYALHDSTRIVVDTLHP